MNNFSNTKSFKQSILVVMIMLVCSPANAQFNLGKLIRKAQEVACGVSNTVSTVSNTVNTVSNAVGTVRDYKRTGFVNPYANVWRIDAIKAVGTRTSMNYGKVWLVINAEATEPLRNGSVYLGGDGTYAVVNGRSQRIIGENAYDMPEGIPMVIDTQKDIVVSNVPASATEIQAFALWIHIAGSQSQKVLWKHIPIEWID